VFVGCEWLEVNKVRALAQDPTTFDEMYKLLLIHFFLVIACACGEN